MRCLGRLLFPRNLLQFPRCRGLPLGYPGPMFSRLCLLIARWLGQMVLIRGVGRGVGLSWKRNLLRRRCRQVFLLFPRLRLRLLLVLRALPAPMAGRIRIPGWPRWSVIAVRLVLDLREWFPKGRWPLGFRRPSAGRLFFLVWVAALVFRRVSVAVAFPLLRSQVSQWTGSANRFQAIPWNQCLPGRLDFSLCSQAAMLLRSRG